MFFRLFSIFLYFFVLNQGKFIFCKQIGFCCKHISPSDILYLVQDFWKNSAFPTNRAILKCWKWWVMSVFPYNFWYLNSSVLLMKCENHYYGSLWLSSWNDAVVVVCSCITGLNHPVKLLKCSVFPLELFWCGPCWGPRSSNNEVLCVPSGTLLERSVLETKIIQ